MVTIGMNYEVREGKERIFEDACRRVIQTMEGMEGHHHSRVFKDALDGSGTYLILSRWTSEEAFQAFVRSDAFRKITTWGQENILKARPSHTTYREG